MQGLTHTGVGSDGNSWNPFTGYGALNTYALMTTSPMSYPDQNPFMNKGYNSTPTRQDVLDYADGVAILVKSTRTATTSIEASTNQ